MSINVLVVAAHPDDEVLGCGGTIARHVAEGDTVRVLYIADGETARSKHDVEARKKAADNACRVLGVNDHEFCDFPDQRLDTVPLLDIIRVIERFKDFPDIIYIHHAGDLNSDHCIVHQATMIAFRPLPDAKYTAIYAFEVPSSTEWGSGFEPDHFVDISDFEIQKDKAMEAYGLECPNIVGHPRYINSVRALVGLRGAQCGLIAAEAFMTMRTIRR